MIRKNGLIREESYIMKKKPGNVTFYVPHPLHYMLCYVTTVLSLATAIGVLYGIDLAIEKLVKMLF